MPTENRSSNTEMVSVPREEIEAACARFAKAQIFDFSRRVRAWLDKPAQHIHPEPIAWMVGTAFWWTKEEAERDAAATGLPIVGLSPMIDTAEAARLRGENEQLREIIKHSDSNIQRQSLRISNQRAQLADKDALLRTVRETLQREYWDQYAGLDETRELIDAAVSASAEPSAALEPKP